MPEFSCTVHTEGRAHTIQVVGEVDMAVASELTQMLEPLLVAGDEVVLDCSDVTFFDSTGLLVAVQAVHRARQTGATFALVPSEPVTRVMELASVKALFSEPQR